MAAPRGLVLLLSLLGAMGFPLLQDEFSKLWVILNISFQVGKDGSVENGTYPDLSSRTYIKGGRRELTSTHADTGVPHPASAVLRTGQSGHGIEGLLSHYGKPLPHWDAVQGPP